MKLEAKPKICWKSPSLRSCGWHCLALLLLKYKKKIETFSEPFVLHSYFWLFLSALNSITKVFWKIKLLIWASNWNYLNGNLLEKLAHNLRKHDLMRKHWLTAVNFTSMRDTTLHFSYPFKDCSPLVHWLLLLLLLPMLLIQ